MAKYEKVEPKCTFADIELKAELRTAVQELVEDREVAHALEREGLIPRKKLFLHGPPGCGKTSIAHALASEMKLPLYVASMAQVSSKYVGEAEKAIEEIFKFAESTECVFLIDEFDTIARNRAETYQFKANEVNTLLVNLESRNPKGVIVACTNFEDKIDPAVLRRFDVIVEVPPLNMRMLTEIAEKILKGRFKISPKECVLEGKTPSGVVRECKNRLRSAVLAEEKTNPTPKPKPKAPEKPLPETIKIDFNNPFGLGLGGGGMPSHYEIAMRQNMERELRRMFIPP